jgi:hypothetical protein
VAAEETTFSVSCGSLPRRFSRGTRYLVRQYGTGSVDEVGRVGCTGTRARIYDQLEAGDFVGVKLDYITCCSVVALAKSKRQITERADQILRRLDNHDGIVGKGSMMCT